MAPYFGGVHETMIKSAKKAIQAILGKADITDEELMTAIIGAEALINSRPLTYQSANPADDVPLTPNHFLHGQIGGYFAPTSCDDTEFYLRRRWRRIQELVRHFWSRWMREWFTGLNARRKLFQTHHDVQVGDVLTRQEGAGRSDGCSRCILGKMGTCALLGSRSEREH